MELTRYEMGKTKQENRGRVAAMEQKGMKQTREDDMKQYGT